MMICLRLRPGQLVEVLQRPHVVVEHPVGGVDVHDAVVRRIPRHADARPEVVEVAAARLRLRHDRDVERERAVASELVLDARRAAPGMSSLNEPFCRS